MASSDLDTRWSMAVDALCALADGYYREGRIGAALHLLEGAGALLRGPTRGDVPPRERHRLALAKGRLDANRMFLLNHDYESALMALQPVADRAAAEGNPRSAAEAHALIGLTLYYRMMWRGIGGYDFALSSFHQALAQYELLDDSRGHAEALFYAGLAHERLGQAEEAQGFYERALDTARAHGHALEESYAVRHLAGLAADQGDFDRALELFERSLALREEQGYRVLLPLSLLAVGNVRTARGEREAALEMCTRAVEIAGTMEVPVPAALCLNSLGTLQRDLGDIAAARGSLERALAVATSVDFHQGMDEAKAALASLPE